MSLAEEEGEGIKNFQDSLSVGILFPPPFLSSQGEVDNKESIEGVVTSSEQATTH